jgi:hypothetical protein
MRSTSGERLTDGDANTAPRKYLSAPPLQLTGYRQSAPPPAVSKTTCGTSEGVADASVVEAHSRAWDYPGDLFFTPPLESAQSCQKA